MLEYGVDCCGDLRTWSVSAKSTTREISTWPCGVSQAKPVPGSTNRDMGQLFFFPSRSSIDKNLSWNKRSWRSRILQAPWKPHLSRQQSWGGNIHKNWTGISGLLDISKKHGHLPFSTPASRSESAMYVPLYDMQPKHRKPVRESKPAWKDLKKDKLGTL